MGIEHTDLELIRDLVVDIEQQIKSLLKLIYLMRIKLQDQEADHEE